MGTYRDEDPLITHLEREQARVLACLMRFANGDGRRVLSEARRTLRALADAEAEIFYPAFSRVRLPLGTQHLLADTRGDRDEQLAALEPLAHKRAARLRKLAALELCDRIKHDDERRIAWLIPVLASQLPRPLYRSIVQAFITLHERNLDHAPRASLPV